MPIQSSNFPHAVFPSTSSQTFAYGISPVDTNDPSSYQPVNAIQYFDNDDNLKDPSRYLADLRGPRGSLIVQQGESLVRRSCEVPIHNVLLSPDYEVKFRSSMSYFERPTIW